MTKLLYWYPTGIRRKGEMGHLVKATRLTKSLCWQVLGKGVLRDKAIVGYALCAECKDQRAKTASHVSLDWAEIDPQSEDFMALSPEHKMVVLAARQAARENDHG